MAFVALQSGAVASPAFASNLSPEELKALKDNLTGNDVMYSDLIKGIKNDLIYQLNVSGNGHTAFFRSDYGTKSTVELIPDDPEFINTLMEYGVRLNVADPVKYA